MDGGVAWAGGCWDADRGLYPPIFGGGSGHHAWSPPKALEEQIGSDPREPRLGEGTGAEWAVFWALGPHFRDPKGREATREHVGAIGRPRFP